MSATGPSDDAVDATSGSAPSPGFEGPEKVLEIDFAPEGGPARGLREISRPQWDRILTEARCTILNSLSNDKFDSYVLSESSLFVYPLKLILKTCGTTTLLRALEPLLEIVAVSSNEARCFESSAPRSVLPPCSHPPRFRASLLPPQTRSPSA
jgi:S-adenosylmethionine decarboxylase